MMLTHLSDLNSDGLFLTSYKIKRSLSLHFRTKCFLHGKCHLIVQIGLPCNLS